MCASGSRAQLTCGADAQTAHAARTDALSGWRAFACRAVTWPSFPRRCDVLRTPKGPAARKREGPRDPEALLRSIRKSGGVSARLLQPFRSSSADSGAGATAWQAARTRATWRCHTRRQAARGRCFCGLGPEPRHDTSEERASRRQDDAECLPLDAPACVTAHERVDLRD